MRTRKPEAVYKTSAASACRRGGVAGFEHGEKTCDRVPHRAPNKKTGHSRSVFLYSERFKLELGTFSIQNLNDSNIAIIITNAPIPYKIDPIVFVCASKPEVLSK